MFNNDIVCLDVYLIYKYIKYLYISILLFIHIFLKDLAWFFFKEVTYAHQGCIYSSKYSKNFNIGSSE